MNHSMPERRAMVEPDEVMSIEEQCAMVSIHRSGFYYQPQGESELNLEIMRLMDEYFLEHPHTGVLTMCAYLCLTGGYAVNVKRVRRLMRLMGVMAIYPKKKLTIPGAGHTIYPYLLRKLKIERVNQVWETDITYIPMQKGSMFMMAVIDVKSRRILHWGVSNTMDAAWCTQVLKEAIALHGRPEISNTDQGSQFTSYEFLEVLKEQGIQISMDGKGRALDNIYIERFWRSLKYEHVYLKPANDGLELYKGIQHYINFYNKERRHHSLNFQTPQESYTQKAA